MRTYAANITYTDHRRVLATSLQRILRVLERAGAALSPLVSSWLGVGPGGLEPRSTLVPACLRRGLHRWYTSAGLFCVLWEVTSAICTYASLWIKWCLRVQPGRLSKGVVCLFVWFFIMILTMSENIIDECVQKRKLNPVQLTSQ